MCNFLPHLIVLARGINHNIFSLQLFAPFFYLTYDMLILCLITRYQAMRGKMNELVRVLDELKQVIRESLDNDHGQNESEEVIC